MSTSSGLYEVRVETRFDASHRRHADGSDAPVHEHRWKIAVRARTRELNRLAIVFDFRILKAAVDRVVAELDRGIVEDHPDFDAVPATPVGVAQWLFEKLSSEVPQPRCWLVAVEVEADPGVVFEYRADATTPP